MEPISPKILSLAQMVYMIMKMDLVPKTPPRLLGSVFNLYVRTILFALRGKYTDVVLPILSSCHCSSSTSEHSQCRAAGVYSLQHSQFREDFQIFSKQETTKVTKGIPDMQCTYKVTLRHVLVSVEKQ